VGPGWPTERQWVMLLTYGMGVMMLVMAYHNPLLWTVELFKTLITVVVVTGFVNQILAYHYAANKDDAEKTANTGKAFEAIAAARRGDAEDPSIIREGDVVSVEKTDGNS